MQPVNRTAVIDTHRWATRLTAGDGVALINDYGDLRARTSGDSGLDYAGVVQKLDGEKRAPEFHTDRLPERLQIRVSAPADWNGRVDASARVPAGSLLDLSTDGGLIEVRTGDNDVVARSQTGRLSIRTQGRIEARGETGDMLIVMLGSEFGDSAGRVDTVSGNIELWLQPHANVTLRASAGGGLDIDAGDSAVVNENASNAAKLTFGEGSAKLDVKSERGALVVRTLPVVELLE